MKTSQNGIEIIRKWEGCKLTAYKCSAGVWTIGIGHTSAAGPPTVKPGMTISQSEANDILRNDLSKYETAVSRAITVSMNQNQFDAMVSLAFNIGPGAFSGSSVVRRFNEGNIAGAADAFLMWTKAGGKELQGLVNRRKDERKLFLTPAAKPAEPSAPSPLPPPPPTPESPPPPSPVPPSVSHNAMAWLVGMILAVLAALAAFLTKEIGP